MEGLVGGKVFASESLFIDCQMKTTQMLVGAGHR